MPTTAPVCMASRQASSSSFSRRIAPTYTLALGFGLFAELLARHGRAVDAIPASLRANVNDGIPFARGFGVEDLVAAHQSQREGGHQRISRVATFELHLAADVGDAEAVSVRGDATDHTFEHRVVLVQSSLIEAGLRRDRTEAQGVHDRERTRAHGEDVAQNAANAGRGSLERLDERRMIVRLDLEGAGPSIADVNDARVLARPLHHAAAVRRESLQVHSRRLVGAVLAPHHAEDAQLGERRLAPERFQNAVVFFRRDPMVAEHFWSDAWFLGDAGCALNWVHGDKEGNSIVARTTGLGKERSQALLLVRFLPVISTDQAFPMVRHGSRRLGKRNSGRPESDLAWVCAGDFANLQRFTLGAAWNIFHLAGFFLGFFRLEALEDFQRAHELAVRYLQAEDRQMPRPYAS